MKGFDVRIKYSSIFTGQAQKYFQYFWLVTID